MLYGHISSSCSHILSWCGSLFEKKNKKTLFFLQKVAFFHEWVTIKNEFLYFSYDSHWIALTEVVLMRDYNIFFVEK